MGELDGERRAALVMGQLAAVWAIGAIGLPIATGTVFLATYNHGTGALAGGVLVALVVFVALLWLTVRVTAAASVLGRTAGGQVGWALLVFGFGVVLWGFGWALGDDPGLALGKNGGLSFLANGLPFVVVAAVLLRGWRARLITIGTLVVVVVATLAEVAQSGPSELAERIEQAQIDRESLYVVSIPGYRPADDMFGDDLGTGTFMPTDPRAIPKPRVITVIAFDRAGAAKGTAGCGETARDSMLAIADCSTEPDGWIYRRAGIEHGYQVLVGPHLVVVSGTHAVERQVLRAAAATLRPVPSQVAGEVLFTVDAPGYEPYGHDVPPGIEFQSTDPATMPPSVQIDVSVDWLDDPCVLATCTADGEGMRFRRIQDQHGYVIRRGKFNVYAMGGVSVDSALLRRVALDARPVTDEELMSALPPVPKQKGALERLRDWLRG